MRKLGRCYLGRVLLAAVFAGLCGLGCAPMRTSHSAAVILPAAADLVSSQGGDPQAAGLQPAPGAKANAAQKSPDMAGPLSLARLIDLALEKHPDLAIAQAQVDAARGQLVQAGLYPNPIVGWVADEMGHPGNAAGFQGPFIAQDIVTGNKLGLAQAAASREVAATDWQATTRRFDLITRVRSAYYEVLSAQRAVEENEKIVGIAKESLRVVNLVKEAGRGIKPDVLRAEIELHQSQIRLGVAQQNLEAAWKLLATAVGVSELPSHTVTGNLEQAAPSYEWQAAQSRLLERSSELRTAQAKIERAQLQVEHARAEAIPNVNLKIRPFYTFPDHRYDLSVEAGVNLPIFNRNEGNIRTAQADLARAGEEARALELQLVGRLTTTFQRYRNATAEADRYKREILPKAREALNAVKTGYEQGVANFDYTTVLQAQQTLVQAQLAYVQALNALWKAASEIAGLLQEE